jgi:3,4-dihydroxy 2-butanone 4-phosphate synthase / GTP cyclohydrolase II
MDPILEPALSALRDGRPVLLLDDCVDGAARPGTEPAGVLVVAAERVDVGAMAFLVRESSGVVCTAMTGQRLDALRIPPLAADGARTRPAFAVAVDLGTGISTGISARDRALTVRALADPATGPADLVRPGHVLPLRARDGGVLERPRPAEAAVALCAAAGLAPAAALATAVDEAGEVAGPSALDALARRAALPVVAVSQVVAHVAAARPPVLRAGASATLPTPHGTFRALGYAGDGGEHLALVHGDVTGRAAVPVHVHVECVAGDVLGSLRCRCGARLAAALAAIGVAGHGVVVYLRSRSAPGLGPVHALRGCAVPDPCAAGVTAHVLHDLGVRGALVLSDDPTDGRDLPRAGIAVAGRRLLLGVPAAEVG